MAAAAMAITCTSQRGASTCFHAPAVNANSSIIA